MEKNKKIVYITVFYYSIKLKKKFLHKDKFYQYTAYGPAFLKEDDAIIFTHYTDGPNNWFKKYKSKFNYTDDEIFLNTCTYEPLELIIKTNFDVKLQWNKTKTEYDIVGKND